ncbi:DNA-binding transcriptional ArsR family regulator [Anaerosolibacter carboniphilus]|uniref:DNA-binding transcriptional ArsR family regulator n=1 Tax=Anaerosolibacter carboniphilus TaxID=1417629 RepID=A0A841KTP6_9FIRM|nr:metalloregulator ArsR/SmtB family transcription factor [Anaerosolibacter carboniphilus]MBB6215400.1 DNA-binding transcriptional ArsR family regulator [Anaerosolibacter carboniphilus]
MRELFHPNIDQLNLPAILKALGDPIRLNIIKNLANNYETTCACCNIDLPKSALSHHFRVLRESGLIKVRIEGKQRFLSIRYEELEERFPGLLDLIIKNI